jgi:hypothetical protein
MSCGRSPRQTGPRPAASSASRRPSTTPTRCHARTTSSICPTLAPFGFFLPPSRSFRLQFEYIPDDALAPETQSGIKFSTITIDTPVYLNWLLARFLAAGGRIVRGAVQHIAQLAEDGVRAFTTPHAGSRALVRGPCRSVRAAAS